MPNLLFITTLLLVAADGHDAAGGRSTDAAQVSALLAPCMIADQVDDLALYAPFGSEVVVSSYGSPAADDEVESPDEPDEEGNEDSGVAHYHCRRLIDPSVAAAPIAVLPAPQTWDAFPAHALPAPERRRYVSLCRFLF